jgi:serine/threonine protein kinase
MKKIQLENNTYSDIIDFDETTIIKRFKFGTLHYSSLKEISIYKILDKNPYFISMKKIYKNDLYLEKYSKTLYDIDPTKLTLDTKVNIFHTLLIELGILHKNNIIHRDIKPTNILWNNETDIKIIDFGLSLIFPYNYKLSQDLSEIAYSKFWRAPEVKKNSKYSFKADIFALGLIFFKLFTNLPDDYLFDLVIHYYNNNKINYNIYIDDFKQYIHSIIDDFTFSIDDPMFDLIIRMITPNKKFRYNIADCLIHKLFVFIKPIDIDQYIVLNNNELVYCNFKYRLKYFDYISYLADNNTTLLNQNLSNQTLFYTYILLDNLFIKHPNFNTFYTKDTICFSCLYLAAAINDAELNLDNNYIFCINDILEIFDYNIVFNNPLNYLIKKIRNKEIKYSDGYDLSLFLIDNYYTKLYPTIDLLLENTIKNFYLRNLNNAKYYEI